MAFGMVFGENEIFLFPFPVLIKAKYFVMILIFLPYICGQGAAGIRPTSPIWAVFSFGFLYVKFGASRPRTKQSSPF